MCIVLLPLGANPIAVIKCIISNANSVGFSVCDVTPAGDLRT